MKTLNNSNLTLTKDLTMTLYPNDQYSYIQIKPTPFKLLSLQCECCRINSNAKPMLDPYEYGLDGTESWTVICSECEDRLTGDV